MIMFLTVSDTDSYSYSYYYLFIYLFYLFKSVMKTLLCVHDETNLPFNLLAALNLLPTCCGCSPQASRPAVH